MSDKFSRINAAKPSNPIDYCEDPDSIRKEEKKEALHHNWLLFQKWLPRFTIALIVFSVILFFIILPISEMSPEFENAWDVIQDYARAFIKTSKTAGIALATLLLSDLMKHLYDYIKKNAMFIDE